MGITVGDITEIHGVKLIADGDMVVFHQRKTKAPFESKSMAAWIDAVGRGSAIDVGAYTGLYSLVAAKAGAKAYAIEPNRDVFKRLIKNIELNDARVVAINKAASSALGVGSMQLSMATKLTSGGKLIPGSGTDVITIDSLGIYDATAIKIDVEGHECGVLLGAKMTIEKCSPLIITEALTESAYREQCHVLLPLGYFSIQCDERNILWRK